jgi:hypothetical protein
MSLELLLYPGAEARRGAPRGGLGEEALRSAPRPGDVESPDELWDSAGDPNDLPAQRWGLVAPAGPRGDKLLALVEPLRRWRQAAQGGAPVIDYRVRSEMDSAYAARWKKEIFRQEGKSELSLPRYLLLLGNLHEVPLELQQALSVDAFVGRLAFNSDAGYTAYVEKVLRWEARAASRSRASMLFYTARDGSSGTELGHQALVAPCVDACRARQDEGDFPRADILELGGQGVVSQEALLAQASEPGPGVLFTLSHGRGPDGGWAGPEARLKHQGELVLPGGKYLPAEALASGPFMPGGIWFSYACFSAGTPARSSYEHWLRQLPATDPNASLGRAALPQRGEQPFIAALPQAALANPDGPLAMMGHVDLAWSYSFNDRGRGTPSRFIELLRVLAEGNRVGVALSTLWQVLNETSSELMSLYNQEELERAQARPSSIDLGERARLWMLRQDLSNYILLGDPAVRLPLAAAVERPAPPPEPTRVGLSWRHLVSPGPPRTGAGAEAALLELLASPHDAEDVAARHGVTLDELRQWEEVYRAAGREALSRHLSGR